MVQGGSIMPKKLVKFLCVEEHQHKSSRPHIEASAKSFLEIVASNDAIYGSGSLGS